MVTELVRRKQLFTDLSTYEIARAFATYGYDALTPAKQRIFDAAVKPKLEKLLEESGTVKSSAA